ncbi:MAG: metallophosphoesterase family protein, partial [Sedimentisphaerales bacterium]|nr:metallophosphoesterase family protein [Sedimentisphaerales bacterium]
MFAVISDIHSNLAALRAVLDDIEHRQIKEVFCLGDIVG